MTAHSQITTGTAIEVKMTWAASAQLIAMGLEAGTSEGKRMAREELARMAAAADYAVASQTTPPEPVLDDQTLADLHDLARAEWYSTQRKARRFELVRLGLLIEAVQASRAKNAASGQPPQI
jgi:hypothetical protein